MCLYYWMTRFFVYLCTSLFELKLKLREQINPFKTNLVDSASKNEISWKIIANCTSTNEFTNTEANTTWNVRVIRQAQSQSHALSTDNGKKTSNPKMSWIAYECKNLHGLLVVVGFFFCFELTTRSIKFIKIFYAW